MKPWHSPSPSGWPLVRLRLICTPYTSFSGRSTVPFVSLAVPGSGILLFFTEGKKNTTCFIKIKFNIKFSQTYLNFMVNKLIFYTILLSSIICFDFIKIMESKNKTKQKVHLKFQSLWILHGYTTNFLFLFTLFCSHNPKKFLRLKNSPRNGLITNGGVILIMLRWPHTEYCYILFYSEQQLLSIRNRFMQKTAGLISYIPYVLGVPYLQTK